MIRVHSIRVDCKLYAMEINSKKKNDKGKYSEKNVCAASSLISHYPQEFKNMKTHTRCLRLTFQFESFSHIRLSYPLLFRRTPFSFVNVSLSSRILSFLTLCLHLHLIFRLLAPTQIYFRFSTELCFVFFSCVFSSRRVCVFVNCVNQVFK